MTQPVDGATTPVELGAMLSSCLGEDDAVQLAGLIDAEVARRVDAGVAAVERRLLLAQEAGQIGTYEIDLSTGVARGTPRFLEIFGLPGDRTGVSTQEWLACVHPLDREKAIEHQRNLLRSADQGNTGEYRVLVRGETRWVQSCDRVDRDPSGRAIHAFGAIQDITDRKEREALIWNAAHHDFLTGLANRGLFQTRLDEAFASHASGSRGVGLLMFDLDHLKSANDVHGHAAGDILLRRVAGSLHSVASEVGGLAARIGGDEFALLVRTDQPQELASLAGHVIANLQRTSAEAAGGLDAGVSAGGSHVDDDHAENGDRLVRNADIALCMAKQRGRGRYVHFRPDLRRAFQRAA